MQLEIGKGNPVAYRNPVSPITSCLYPNSNLVQGCTKYGAVGLSYLLRWHMTPEGKPLTAENEASLSRALSGLLRSKQGSTAQPDEATLAALEVCFLAGSQPSYFP